LRRLTDLDQLAAAQVLAAITITTASATMTTGAYLGEKVVREKEYLSAILSFYSQVFSASSWTGVFATGF
jgi:hypothetical protein